MVVVSVFMDGFTGLMVAIYAGTVIFGYILASRQIKLVKLEEFARTDHAKALIFGLLFGAGVSFIVGMMVAVGSNNQAPLAEFQQTLLIAILIFISAYPLLDLLYLASSDHAEGQTPYHTLIANKVINRYRRPKSYVAAILLYFGLFIGPIFLLWGVSGFTFPFIIIWMSWIVVVPILVLSYYATIGFVEGIMRAYFHIPAMGRSTFLSLENAARATEDFKDNPGSRISFGFTLFTFVWQFYSLVQTLAYFATGKLSVNTASYTVMALYTLFLGIMGYFTRFWGRKIKFRTMDLLLSAWIMTTIGANVLINFALANQSSLFLTFDSDFFRALVDEVTAGPMGYHRYLAFAAALEEIILITVITYYFTSKRSKVVKDKIMAILSRARLALDPVPLFNLIRTSYPEVNAQGEQAVMEVYERLPLKKPRDLARGHYLYPVLDAMCDDNGNVRRVGRAIFANLVKSAPAQMLPWAIGALQSPNYDKRLPVADALLEMPNEFLGKVPRNVIYALVKDPNWLARKVGIKVLVRMQEISPDPQDLLLIKKALDDGDNDVQAEALLALAHSGGAGLGVLVLPKLSHPSEQVRRAAAQAVGKIGLDKIDASAAPILIDMMKSASASSKIAAFEAIQKVGKISEFRIPIEPIVKGLFDGDLGVQQAASKAMQAVCDIEPYKVNVDYLVAQFNNGSAREKVAILPILGKLWKDFPTKIFPIIISSIGENDPEIKNVGASVARDIGKKEPLQVAQNLIAIPEKGGLITKGVVSRTLIDLGKLSPKSIIPLLNKAIQSEDANKRYNAAAALEELGPEYPDQVDFAILSSVYGRSGDPREKKQVAKIISEVITKDPRKATQGMQVLVDGLKDPDQGVRISMAKTLRRVSETAPDIVPMQVVKDHLKDPDPLVREAMIRVLGEIGSRFPDQVLIILLDLLGAEDWTFRNAAAEALASLVKTGASQPMVLEHLVKRLGDTDKWVRYKVLLAITGMLEKKPDAVPVEVIFKALSDSDEKVRETAIRAIGKVGARNFVEAHGKLMPFMKDPSQNIRDATASAYFDMSSKVEISTMLPKLLQLLGDEVDLETQRTVAQILRRVAKYEKAEIKTRIIKILRIRCEMSHDKTICNVLSEFEQG